MSEDRNRNSGDMPHHRRLHYSGTHPHTYAEKYKEHQPEKYSDIIEKVIRKGSTPAGMHLPIMADEILRFLAIQPGETGLDATLGYGGHSRRMLEALQGKGHLYALDVDPIESVKTEKRLREAGFGEDLFTVRRMNFADIDTLCSETGRFDFVLADLGVSSMQIDDPSRGFSYKTDGPLDLRMNPEKGISAAERLLSVDVDELEGMLTENADEPYAAAIAQAIVSRNKTSDKIRTTGDLRETIEKTMEKNMPQMPKTERRKEIAKTCGRVFQAIRIDVNSEFEVLDALMEKLPGAVKPGGRIAILTFHSGEDRIVKKAFKYYHSLGLYSSIARDVIRPSAEECHRNPRAHSAKLRWAVRSSLSSDI